MAEQNSPFGPGNENSPHPEMHSDEFVGQYISTPGNTNQYEVGVDIPGGGGSDTSFFNDLANGFAVAVADDPTAGTSPIETRDLTSFPTDEQGLQELVNFLEANPPGGKLWIPSRNTDGTNVRIESEVNTDPNLLVSVDIEQFNGSFGQDPTDARGILELATTGGDAAFRVNGDVGGTSALRGAHYKFHATDHMSNDTCLIEAKFINNSIFEPGVNISIGGDMMRCLGNFDGNWINRSRNTFSDGGTGDLIRLANPDGLSPPGGDNLIGPYVKCDGDHETSINNEGLARTRITGVSLEGAKNAAVHNHETGSSFAQCFIDAPCQLASTTNVDNDSSLNGHGLLMEDRFCWVRGVDFSGIAGDAIRFDTNGGGEMVVSSDCRFNDITGDSINFVNDPGSFQPTVLPDRDTVKGTVTYPTGTSGSAYERQATLL